MSFSSPVARFRPRLLDALQGYSRARLLGDVGAGLTVAVVALPLAMAFAIASGLTPEAGIYTTIVAGFLVAVLGGSRVQIGGPAGAFIVIVYGIVQQAGVAGLLMATVMSGVLLFLMGLFRLGTLVRFIPVAVITGFTNGIAVLIALSQIKDFLGLNVLDMPADFFGILHALAVHLHTFNPWALAVALGSFVLIALWPLGLKALAAHAPLFAKWRALPGPMVALVVATGVVAAFNLPVETIGTKFGGIPSELPAFGLPEIPWEAARGLLMPAITLALLGAIESLLCARVADGMIRDRHDPNQELMAQGIANVAAPLLGGMPATGTIARTVTNVKSGASSPVAGIVHALVLLVVVLVAAPLASSIPLACLAAILMHVAWNMGEWRAFARLRRFRPTYGVTLVAVFLLTVIFDLTVAVQFGILAACVIFIYRMSSLAHAEPVRTDEFTADNTAVGIWRLSGALFFGSTTVTEALHDKLPQRVLVLDLEAVIYMDSTGAAALHTLADACHDRGVAVIAAGLAAQPLDQARRSGWLETLGAALQPDLATALATTRALLAQGHA